MLRALQKPSPFRQRPARGRKAPRPGSAPRRTCAPRLPRARQLCAAFPSPPLPPGTAPRHVGGRDRHVRRPPGARCSRAACARLRPHGGAPGPRPPSWGPRHRLEADPAPSGSRLLPGWNPCARRGTGIRGWAGRRAAPGGLAALPGCRVARPGRSTPLDLTSLGSCRRCCPGPDASFPKRPSWRLSARPCLAPRRAGGPRGNVVRPGAARRGPRRAELRRPQCRAPEAAAGPPAPGGAGARAARACGPPRPAPGRPWGSSGSAEGEGKTAPTTPRAPRGGGRPPALRGRGRR